MLRGGPDPLRTAAPLARRAACRVRISKERAMIRACLAALCLFCLAGTAGPVALAAERNLVVVAHDPTSPPMEFLDQDELTGYAVDYIDAVAKEAGFLVEHRKVHWDGSFSDLSGKKYDVLASSVTITPERTAVVSFSQPYYEVRQVLVTPKNVKAASMDDMKGEDVGALFGSTGFAAIKKTPGVHALSFEDFSLAMASLVQDRIDAVVCDDVTAASYLAQNKTYAEKLKIAFVIPSDTPSYYGFVVRQGDKRLLEILNKGIDAVKAKGIENELKKKWLDQYAGLR